MFLFIHIFFYYRKFSKNDIFCRKIFQIWFGKFPFYNYYRFSNKNFSKIACYMKYYKIILPQPIKKKKKHF